MDGQADQWRGDERDRSVKAARSEKRLRDPHPFPEQSRPGHRRGDPRRDRTRRAIHRKAHRAADPGGLERAAETVRDGVTKRPDRRRVLHLSGFFYSNNMINRELKNKKN